MRDKLIKQIEFLLEADKMKNIRRRTLIADGTRQENDAEHSWHFALMAYILRDYASNEVDIDRVIRMALVHDLVEVYAGDTYAYDTEGNKSKAEREQKAADRLFGMLPGGQGEDIRALWEEFDAAQTPDACFAAAIDRLQPMINNYYTNGVSWKENNARADMVYRRMEPVRRASEELWQLGADIIESAVKKGWLTR